MNAEYICDGRCCERFFFPRTPQEVEELKAGFENGLPNDVYDTETIVNMLIYIDGETASYEEGHPLRGAWYTCKNWDTETRRCNIYETRPMMCRGYPYGKECNSCGSTCGTSEDWYEKELEIRTRVSGGISFEEVSSRVADA